MIFRFAVGGKVIALDPQKSVSSLCIEEAKIFYRDFHSEKTVELLDSFKGEFITIHYEKGALKKISLRGKSY